MSELITKVADILRAVAAAEIMPLWKNLAQEHVQRKSDQSVVTAADVAAERALIKHLASVLPEPVVVGEELAESNPEVLKRLSDDSAVWIIDPIDGTRSFANGSEDFGIMVALRQQGELTHSWLYAPARDTMMTAELGAGAWLNGKPLTLPALPPLDEMRICLAHRFWPQDIRQPLSSCMVGLGTQCDHVNAITTFTELATGTLHALLDPARRPWDVAPGVVLYRAMGGIVKHLDGSLYTAAPPARGLLYAPTEEIWNELAERVRPCLVG